MFVSSYTTFIPAALQERVQPQRESNSSKEASSFAERLLQVPSSAVKTASFPVDYVAKNSGFWQKYEVQREIQRFSQEAKKEETKSSLGTIQKFQSAEAAYSEGVKKFSFILKNTKATTIDQTPRVDTTLPSQLQEMQESKLRNKMINTYVSNDRYYRITAA